MRSSPDRNQQHVGGASAPHASSRTERRSTTRNRLLDAARIVVIERGAAVSIHDVCVRAGYSRGAFYSNFSSKEHLLLALWQQLAANQIEALVRLRRELEEEQGRALGADEITRRLYRALGDSRVAVLLHLEFRLIALRDPAFAKSYQHWSQQILAAIASVAHISHAAPAGGRATASALAVSLFTAWEAAETQEALERLSPRTARAGPA